MTTRQRLELVKIIRMVVGENPGEGALFTGHTADAQAVDVYLTPEALATLEAFLARANQEQAKRQPSH